MTDNPFDDESPFESDRPFEGDSDDASTGQEPRTVSTTRIEIDGGDDYSDDTPVVYNWEENPAETFGPPADATFVVSLDTATARTDSMTEAVDLITDEWVELYCRHLCGFRDSGASEALIRSVTEIDHVRRTFRARAIKSLGTATVDVPAEYEQTVSSFFSEIESRVGDIALDDSTVIAVRESQRDKRDKDLIEMIRQSMDRMKALSNIDDDETAQTYQLEVAEADPDDTGMAIARVDPDTMIEQGITPGDILQIKGKAVTVTKAWRADRDDWDEGIIRLDEYTRQNASVEVGETVWVRHVDVPDAERVVLVPQNASTAVSDLDIDVLKKHILKRPLIVHGVVPYRKPSYAETEGFGDPIIPFIAQSVEPECIGLVTEETTIEIDSHGGNDDTTA